MHKDTTATPLFLQHRTLEIIQLIEVPAPPRVQHPSTIASSSAATSSTSYLSTSTSGIEDADSVASSSYCSSAEGQSDVFVPDDTYKIRLTRVLAWRESSAKVPGGSQLTTPLAPAVPLKRKVDGDDDGLNDDAVSHSSKRSRSSTSRLRSPWPKRRFSEHSCPACDTSFPTRRSLQQHGRDASLSDACRQAVEYGFEA
ncbi:hypothetical protein BKA93DRAFT_816554 [Sparassis latifolia]